MDGVRPGLGSHAEDGILIEVGDGRGGIKPPGVIGQAHVQGILLPVAVDGDGAHAKLPCSANDPYGDLAAIGNEERAQFCAWSDIKHGRDDNRVPGATRYAHLARASGVRAG